MKPGGSSWNWIEVPAREYADQTFESLTAKYRGDKPVALLTPLENLAGYTVLNVFAPKHSAFWAALGHSRVEQPCYESINHLHGDKDARALFMKDLRQAKIRKSDKQIRLFEKYAQILGVEGSGVPNLGIGYLRYPESWRFWSMGFPTGRKDEVVDFLEREVEELGKYAFYRIDESVELADSRGRKSLGFYLFHGIDLLDHPTQAARDLLQMEVLSELKFVVSRLESGGGFDTPIEPVWIVKGLVSFALLGATDDHPISREYELSRQIISYRARLVHLLGWPSHHASVSRAIEPFRKSKSGRNPDRFEPYDVEAELQAYLDQVGRLYPIVHRRLFE